MKPKLYIFAISHYCEKARWALDYLGIDYELVYLAPGLHFASAKKLGVAATSLPILDTGSEIIQGSASIIDWADSATRSTNKLTPAIDREECAAIEKRLDDVVGVHTRRMFYSESLVEHPSTVRPIFTKDLALPQRLLTIALWPIVRRKMIAGMDLGFDQGVESKNILEQELAWLDGLLADGRPYLAANTFTRADLTAASLMARLSGAKEHPSAAFMSLPPRATALAKQWHDRKSMQWIRGIYRQHR